VDHGDDDGDGPDLGDDGDGEAPLCQGEEVVKIAVISPFWVGRNGSRGANG
jgi:hypothetical protein